MQIQSMALKMSWMFSIKIALKIHSTLYRMFYQSPLIIVKLFHFETMFNKVKSLLNFFIHDHAVGGHHICYLHKL